MHIPAPLAFLAICAEFLGGIGLVLGLLGRVVAFGILCNMLVAVWMVHFKLGFFLTIGTAQKRAKAENIICLPSRLPWL